MSGESPKDTEYMDEEVNLLDYIAVIVKYRQMVFYMCGIAVILAIIVSYSMPAIYSSRAVILPPHNENSGMSGLKAMMGGFSSFAGGMLGMKTSSDMYVDMLKSRTIQDTIIKKFSLLEVYKVEFMKEARATLDGNTQIAVSKSETISITVEDTDPQLSTDLANAYVVELDKLNRKLNISGASLQRNFLEERLDGTKQRLHEAESKLKQFQKENKIIVLEEQVRVSIQGAARIKGEIIALETELMGLRGFVTEEKNQVVILKQKLRELKIQLAKIERGPEAIANPGKSDTLDNNDLDDNFYIPFTQAPALGIQLARFMREIKIHETVFELLTQQYELARIAESKDMATIQVIDKAIVPEKKIKPKKKKIVVLSGIVALFVSLFMAFIREYFDKMNDGDKKRWQDIKAQVRGSVLFYSKNNKI